MGRPVSRSSAPHYGWGDGCDGWRLAAGAGLSVIEERVPPGGSEKRHVHRVARQFFYVLEGRAVIELGGTEHAVGPGEGLEVEPGVPHRFFNPSDADVVFLVVSAPSTSGDREDA